jgi:hypothetical protein
MPLCHCLGQLVHNINCVLERIKLDITSHRFDLKACQHEKRGEMQVKIQPMMSKTTQLSTGNWLPRKHKELR